ncbi:hypothetical protein LguiA_036186 [Lonicera macranthoides]
MIVSSVSLYQFKFLEIIGFVGFFHFELDLIFNQIRFLVPHRLWFLSQFPSVRKKFPYPPKCYV